MRGPRQPCAAIPELTSDGQKVSISAFDPARGRGHELIRLELHGTPIWDLSPDGTRIANIKNRENAITVFSLKSTSHQAEIPVKGWSIGSLYWAADGKGFFVSGEGRSGSGLLHVDLEGEVSTLWEQKGNAGLYGVPSPDGRHLAIAATLNNSNVWMLEGF